ncbi:peptidyl-tRNA hydrolase, PTH1 family [Spirosomataceae bacterium TFI 002]|nr:peptidyl-tRNA hydrolase, PTH1 family [Spirosomataceae bacterium TFI 002]
MKYLIAGLGNIGPQYAFTRHNIGFMALDRLAAQQGLKFEMKKLAYHTEWKTKGRTIHLIKPTTFMNLSGKAVRSYMQQHKIPVENLLVVTDDISLPTGKLRLKPKGSAGGHNGLKDIEAQLQTQEYARIKIGVGDDFPRGRQADYVLSNFPEDEMIGMILKLDKVSDMILSFCTVGCNNTMNSFNE